MSVLVTLVSTAILLWVGLHLTQLLFHPAWERMTAQTLLQDTFLPLVLSMHINRLGLFNHLYRSLFICITICLGSWAYVTVLCIEVAWCSTVDVLAWYSAHQLPGCKCTVKRSHAPFKRLNAAYMCMYGHMQPYVHAFEFIYEFQIYICIKKHLIVYLFVLKCFYIHRYMRI